MLAVTWGACIRRDSGGPSAPTWNPKDVLASAVRIGVVIRRRIGVATALTVGCVVFAIVEFRMLLAFGLHPLLDGLSNWAILFSSVVGAPLPYSYTISTSIFRITKRVLDVNDYSATGYRDDAMTQTVNGQTNDLSGSGLSDILVVGSSMTVTRQSIFSGYVPPVQSYTLNTNGTMSSTRDGHMELYQKQ